MPNEPEWMLSADGLTLTLLLPTNPPVAFKLDAAGVESMITNFGRVREEMKPSIAADFAMGQAVEAVQDPRWASEPDALMGNSVLHMRDPRYGWLHYLIPKETAAQLGRVLLNQAEAPPPGLGHGKPS